MERRFPVVRLLLCAVLTCAGLAAVAAPVSAAPGYHFSFGWGSGPGSGPAQFNLPRGIATDPAGNVYVSDLNNNRIQKFSPSGSFLTT